MAEQRTVLKVDVGRAELEAYNARHLPCPGLERKRRTHRAELRVRVLY